MAEQTEADALAATTAAAAAAEAEAAARRQKLGIGAQAIALAVAALDDWGNETFMRDACLKDLKYKIRALINRECRHLSFSGNEIEVVARGALAKARQQQQQATVAAALKRQRPPPPADQDMGRKRALPALPAAAASAAAAQRQRQGGPSRNHAHVDERVGRRLVRADAEAAYARRAIVFNQASDDGVGPLRFQA